MTVSFLFYELVSAVTSATVSAVISLGGDNALCAKFAGWEGHATEDVAGVILFNGAALFFGDAIFGSLDQELRGTHKANYREDAKRYRQIAFVTVVIVK